ncbi:hypothetical protein RCH08_005391 [Janthinobacterium sp. CG_S6]|nr:hypothetical protein [Janthinobacterium sp. CG_S6]
MFQESIARRRFWNKFGGLRLWTLRVGYLGLSALALVRVSTDTRMFWYDRHRKPMSLKRTLTHPYVGVGKVLEVFQRLLVALLPFDQQPFLGSHLSATVALVSGTHPYGGKAGRQVGIGSFPAM